MQYLLRVKTILDNADAPMTLNQMREECQFTRQFTYRKFYIIIRKLLQTQQIARWKRCSKNFRLFPSTYFIIYFLL